MRLSRTQKSIPDRSHAMLHTSRRGTVVHTIKVLLVEDNPFLLNGIENLLNLQPDINVIKTAADVEHLEASLAECKDSVILLDVSRHAQNSLRVTEKLSRETSGYIIIVMDLFPVQEDIEAFVKAGACGFINKDETLEQVLETIRAVAGGEHVLPKRLPGSLFSRIVEHAVRRTTVRLNEKVVKLTASEQKIIACAGEGISNDEIARRLKIRPCAVQRHTDSILHKLALRKILLPGKSH
jgi:DNA-binding NarL/FixJ family response regulator